MARGIHRLTVLRVSNLQRRGQRGLHSDGGGLYLQVTGRAAASWLLRYKRHGRSRYMGLGPVALVSLGEARERSREARRLLLAGTDPIQHRKEAKAQAALEAART